MKRGICGGIMAVLFAVLVGILLAPWRWDGAGGMHLLGEELIDGGGSARRFAHAMHSEATAIWADRRSWHQATRQSDAHESMQVESIRIDHGPFNASGVLLTRGVATIANVSARALYQLLSSAEGFAIIDPISEPEDFSKFNERFWWRHGRLAVAPGSRTWQRLHIAAPVPGRSPRLCRAALRPSGRSTACVLHTCSICGHRPPRKWRRRTRRRRASFACSTHSTTRRAPSSPSLFGTHPVPARRPTPTAGRPPVATSAPSTPSRCAPRP